MNYGGISIDAYANQMNDNFSGYGNESLSNVDELNKALSAGEQRGGEVDGQAIPGQGAPLKVESLDKTLKTTTFTQRNIVLWKELSVLPAYNTVEEYNRLISYGSDIGGFITEGELPEENDSTYVRKSELVKYLGTTRIVTHPMTLVNSAHGAVMTREAENGTIWILQKLERGLFHANSNIVPIEFKGFIAQQKEDFATDLEWLNSDCVIDCEGYTLDEKFAETGSNVIVENYGFGTDFYGTPRALSDFVKTFYIKERVGLPANNNGQSVGMKVNDFLSNAGSINLKPDIFLRPRPRKSLTSAPSSAKAPTAPVADVSDGVTPIAPTVDNGKWKSTDAGNYFYAVSGINRYGESALTLLESTVTAVATGGAVDLKFTAGVGSYATNGFVIYRSEKNATVSTGYFYPLFEISTAQLTSGYHGGTSGIVRDLNRFRPNTTTALMMQRDLEVLSFKQLAPLMKMDLAVISPAFRFMVLLYGTPILYAPRKMVVFINIGQQFA